MGLRLLVWVFIGATAFGNPFVTHRLKRGELRRHRPSPEAACQAMLLPYPENLQYPFDGLLPRAHQDYPHHQLGILADAIEGEGNDPNTAIRLREDDAMAALIGDRSPGELDLETWARLNVWLEQGKNWPVYESYGKNLALPDGVLDGSREHVLFVYRGFPWGLEGTPSDVDVLSNLWEARLPTLRHLTIHYSAGSPDHASLPERDSFHHFWQDTRRWLSILSRMESLHLAFQNFSADLWLPHDTSPAWAITPPSQLKHLQVTTHQPGGAQSVLQHFTLRFPSLNQGQLESLWVDSTVNSLVRHHPLFFSRIKRLSVGGAFSTDQLSALLDALPTNVQFLDFSHATFETPRVALERIARHPHLSNLRGLVLFGLFMGRDPVRSHLKDAVFRESLHYLQVGHKPWDAIHRNVPVLRDAPP